MNSIALTGNLTADPEKVTLPDNRVLANFRIGNSEYVNGETRDNGFFDITVFGQQAEMVLQHLKKGNRVVVAGRLQHTTYERENGSTGARTKLIASAVGKSLEFKPRES